MKLFAALLVLPVVLWACLAHGESVWPVDMPLPQDALLTASLRKIDDKREDIQEAMVVVQMGHGEDNPRWMMSHTQLQVFINKLFDMPERPFPEDDIWPKLKPVDPSYKGITVVLQTWDQKRFEPIRVFEGRVTAPGGVLLTPDFGRQLEYWMFGTARVRRDQLLGVNVLPVLSFEQCRLLGQRIVETSPRQCLLPDNNLLLETSEAPTLKSAKLRDFDGCLKDGKALIYTFPRRCVAAGGRVFTEPPRVAEEKKLLVPVDAGLSPKKPEVGSGTKDGNLKELILRSIVTQTAVVSGAVVPGVPVSASAPALGVSATGISTSLVPVGAPVGTPVGGSGTAFVSSTQALNDADLAKIAPAAGPAPVRWYQRIWRIPLADFGF